MIIFFVYSLLILFSKSVFAFFLVVLKCLCVDAFWCVVAEHFVCAFFILVHDESFFGHTHIHTYTHTYIFLERNRERFIFQVIIGVVVVSLAAAADVVVLSISIFRSTHSILDIPWFILVIRWLIFTYFGRLSQMCGSSAFEIYWCEIEKKKQRTIQTKKKKRTQYTCIEWFFFSFFFFSFRSSNTFKSKSSCDAISTYIII